MKISVVVPVYGCPAAVKPLSDRLCATLSQVTEDFEIILVNDACPRGSWAEIEKVCAENPKVIGIEMARNFGQIRAITAGLGPRILRTETAGTIAAALVLYEYDQM